MTNSAVSVSGGIVSFIDLPHISPSLDKAGIMLDHVTGPFFTGAAFSSVSSRRNLNTGCDAVIILLLELQVAGSIKKAFRTSFSSVTAVSIRFLARKESRFPLVLGP